MIFAVGLDFETKQLQEVSIDRVGDTRDSGQFCWVHLREGELDQISTAGEQWGIEFPDWLIDEQELIHTPFFDSEEFLAFVISDVRLNRDGLEVHHSRIVVGRRFILTLSHHESEIISGVQTTFSKNFRQVALSPGFMLFEFADHLSHQYTQVLRSIADRTEEIELELFGEVGDAIFAQVADLLRSILEFYKLIVSTREVFHDLSTRRSPFIPETTQPYLEKKAALLERLSADVTSEREVLSETLNLYMGIVTHRTNKLVTKLTVISMLFLPLSFLVGVWGMNFKFMPELEMRYAYVGFWLLVMIIAGSMVAYMRRNNWL
jgi:magnesium transporter